MAKPVLYIKSATARQMKKWRKDGDPVAMCAHFGCGKRLTLFEQLCGNKCVAHYDRVRKSGMNQNF